MASCAAAPAAVPASGAEEPHTPLTVTRRVMAGRFEADTRDLNAVLQAIAEAGLDRGLAYTGSGAASRHLAEVVADENLSTAPIWKIERRFASLMGLSRTEFGRLFARSQAGRSVGGTAGAFNRDMRNLGVRLDAARGRAARLGAELERRAALPAKVLVARPTA